MSAERTLAVQAELAGRPDVSVALLTWTLCLALFERTHGKRSQPLKASVSSNQYHLASLAPSGDEGKALTALNAQKKALQATLPENWHLDFTWLLSWSAEQIKPPAAMMVPLNVLRKRRRKPSGSGALMYTG